MLRNFVGFLVVGYLVASFGSAASAAMIASDDFETYTGVPTGLNGLNGGTGWLNAWSGANTATGTFTVVSGGLSYAPLDIQGGTQSMQMSFSGDATEVIISRQFAAQTAPLYLGFLYQNVVDADPANSGNDFMQFGYANTSNGNPAGSVLDRSTTFQVRAGTGTQTDTGVVSTAGQTYFLVLKVENTGGTSSIYDRMTVYVNPTSFTESDNTSFTASSADILNLSSNAFFNIRRAFQENGDVYRIDHLIIGDDFISVIPEPSTWLLGSLAACSLVWLGRKRMKLCQRLSQPKNLPVG